MDSWAEFHQQIDARLDAARPQRSSHDTKDWREPVYGWARNHIPDESNLPRHFAAYAVDRRETLATRRGNRLLRQWAKGQRPLIWSDLGALPVTVEKVRIRLDAVTPDDIDDAAREIEVMGKATYDEVVLLAQAMRDLGRAARREGLTTVALLGDLDARKPNDEIMPLSDDEDDDFEDDEDF